MRSCLVLALVAACGFYGHAPAEMPIDAEGDGASIHDAPGSGSAADAPTTNRDGPRAPVAPVVVASTVQDDANVATLSYAIDVGAAADRYLLVSVQLGGTCPAGTAPLVTGVTFDNVALTVIDSVLGTPCGALATRSEQWGLIAPHTGSHLVIVTLAGNAPTIHSGAIAMSGVDQTAPVRAHATAGGTGKQALVTVTSAATDVVVSTVGQGRMIAAPGDASQTELYLHNHSTSNTLDNSAASWTAGAAPSVGMQWMFVQDQADEWQAIASSLRPAP